MSDTVSRRRFLAASAAAVGLGPVLAACGGGGPTTASACAGYTDLSPEQLQSRQALNYVDRSLNAEQYCANCRLYNAPADDGACGECQLFAGPVIAKGHCTGWVPQAA